MDEIKRILLSNLNKKVEESDIDLCYRVGRKNNDKPQAILLKLSSAIRNQIFSKKKLLKGSKVVITEDLTPTRVDLQNLAIAKLGLKNAWTESSNVFVNYRNKNNLTRKLSINVFFFFY